MTLKDAIIERGSIRHLNQSLLVLRDAAKDIDMMLSGAAQIDAESRHLIRSITELMNILDRECHDFNV